MDNSETQELQDLLTQAQEQVKKLELKINELQNKPKNVRWRAEKGKQFYLVSGSNGEPYKMIEDNGTCCNFHYETGDYFETANEARDYYKNLITRQKLKDIALRLNDGGVNYYFIYLNSYGELVTAYQTIKIIGGIYCTNHKFLETAIKEIGEEELIRFIKEC